MSRPATPDREVGGGTLTGPKAAHGAPTDGTDAALTRRGHKAAQAARHALRLPMVPRDFRADIEGMRAISVLGVLLWHAGVTLLPGGFTGVDVFFVVSGFLMTALLLEEARTRGRIDLGRFYARRARRLLPAALTALVGTAMLTVLLLPRTRWSEVGGDVVAAATYLVNWRMAWRSVDYLDLERAPSPVQHYWSLAVEEQFYVLWPILLLGVLVLAAARARAFLSLAWTLTLLLFGASLWVSWVWTQRDPSAYFVTPTRVYELMLGAVVALGAGSWPRLPRVIAAPVGWVGLGMVLASLVIITPETLFPGTWALLPTVGAALVLVAGPAAGAWGPLVVLRARLLQSVGRLSYSLYLWHWPFIAVAAHLAGVGRGGPTTLPVVWGLLAVLVSVVPAWLSFRYVEDPIRRHGRLLAGQLPTQIVTWRTLRLGLNLTLGGALVGIGLLTAAPSEVTSETAQWRTPGVVDEARKPVGAGTLAGEALSGEREADGGEADGAAADGDRADDAAATSVGHPAADAAATTGPSEPVHTTARGLTGARSSVALGEPLPAVEIPQNIGRLAVPLEQVPDDRPVMLPEGCFIGLTGAEVGTCLGGDPDGATRIALIGDSHAGMWLTALDEIGRDRGWRVVAMTKSSCPPGIDLVVRRSGQAGDYEQCSAWQEGLDAALEAEDPDVVLLSSASYPEGDESLAAGLRARIEWISDELDALPVLLRDVPRAPFNVPACLSDHPDDVAACAFPRAEAVADSGTGHDELIDQLPSLPFIDLTDAICPARTCSPIVGGVVVWRDSNHLSATYVRSLRDAVEEELVPMVRAADLRSRATDVLDLGGAVGS